MAYVRTVAYEKAEGDIKDAYDGILESRGYIPNLHAVSALRPHIMKSLDAHSKAVMQGDSGLSLAEREMIATVVSAVNRCVY